MVLIHVLSRIRDTQQKRAQAGDKVSPLATEAAQWELQLPS